MQVNSVTERIRAYLTERFPLTRRINTEESLLGSGLIDSLGVLELVTFLEQEFHISIADEDLLPENFQSVVRLAAFTQSKLNGSSARQSKE